ncbi:uncharacterized protein LOC141617365 [Silene latifolia]|uniref:uncharacterized protein LOC141617365 n=1 Tax=Silene latifolia TaxID=37657 RepID=UPI003D777946
MRRVREKLDWYYEIDVDSAGRSGGGERVACDGFLWVASCDGQTPSWDLLRLLYDQSSLPWLCIGDFNEILFSTEMKGGSRPQWQMNNFQAVVDFCGLRDVAWEGYAFTYDNGQAGDNNRQSMIDRAMCSASWLELFPYAKNYHLDREWSDHAPLKLIFDRREIGGITRSRF